MTSQRDVSASAVVTSGKRYVKPRRAASMEDHDTSADENRRAVSGEDSGVRSAHSSPSRGRRRFTWLRKVANSITVLISIYAAKRRL